MEPIGDYNKIMADRKLFNKTVYTPMSEALRLLDERRKDPELMAKVEKLLNGDIPEILKSKKCGILARQLATPNHENRMFIRLAKENGLYPVFFECYDDKFTSNNKFKHSLGQLHIQNGKNKNDKDMLEKITIIDFNKSNGKKLHEVKTTWGESLVDFHHRLFTTHDINDIHFLDEKDWNKESGNEKPDQFYLKFFLLNTCFGILFENFLTSKGPEGDFTKKIILPAIDKVVNLTGVKLLIVPIGPLEVEDDDLWYHHLPLIKKLIPNHNND
ncbi:MAG: hypothetical protein Q7K54_01805 [Candidatus Parcubacteria bacterium]|nr:hypothetical protein [Candidatus Parcubacteria bacterium]